MASEIGVQKLMHTNATQAATINSSGQLIIDDGLHKSGSVNTSIGPAIPKVYYKINQSTPATNDSLGLSSFTDTAAGNFTMTFTNAFDSTHFGATTGVDNWHSYFGSSPTTTTIIQTAGNSSHSLADSVIWGQMIGDLA